MKKKIHLEKSRLYSPGALVCRSPVRRDRVPGKIQLQGKRVFPYPETYRSEYG